MVLLEISRIYLTSKDSPFILQNREDLTCITNNGNASLVSGNKILTKNSEWRRLLSIFVLTYTTFFHVFVLYTLTFIPNWQLWEQDTYQINGVNRRFTQAKSCHGLKTFCNSEKRISEIVLITTGIAFEKTYKETNWTVHYVLKRRHILTALCYTYIPKMVFIRNNCMHGLYNDIHQKIHV